jgi:proteic killer suppression protein
MNRIAQRKLKQLNATHDLRDLTIFPGNRLEALKGNRRGQYSIRINDNTASASFGVKPMLMKLR